MNASIDDLRPLGLFEGLPDEQLAWFCEHGECRTLGEGERMFERGDVADAMWVVLKGSVQGFEEHGGQWLLVATTRRGEVTGMLPFSRMTHYPRHTVAREPTVVMRIDASLFEELMATSYEVGKRLVATMSDRVRGDVRLEQQQAKMASLGQLSAGLAHELNNPAAAVRRAASRLADNRKRLPGLVTALVRHDVGEDGLAKLEGLRALEEATDVAALSDLQRSEIEDDLSDWLEDKGVAEPWQVAATLCESGITAAQLEGLEGAVPEEAMADAVAWLSGGIESDRIVGEISAAAGRISELIASIKTYTHMDRSTEHKPTDVRTGIDNTLTMLGHKMKKKSIRLAREYADVPLIPANAGELNQVWTNVIDNAIDAMEEGGTLTLRTKRTDPWVQVEIVDDGPGIPEDARARIFDPFFTTKDVGVGTGLGLGIANRIVKTHQGHIEVRSRPGETVMCVRLPVDPDSIG